MNIMKRIVALLLAVVMTMAMTLTAFAAQDDGVMPLAEIQKGSLTVRAMGNQTLENQTVILYKLFTLTKDSSDNYAYFVNSDYKDILAEVLSISPDGSDQDFYNAVQSKKEQIQIFANDFTKKVKNKNGDNRYTFGKEEKVTSHTFEDIEYGYYLVYLKNGKDIQSSLVSVDDNDSEINLKTEAPDIEKTADKGSVTIGDVVTYTITTTIPNTKEYLDYQYIIHDKLTSGLDFVENIDGQKPVGQNYNVSLKIDGKGSTDQATAILSGTENREMTLDLSEYVRNNQAHIGKTLTITYYAKVNSNAVVVTNNEASLEYGNNKGETITTTPDVVDTPTYPITIKKHDSTGKFLADAKFALYNSIDNATNNVTGSAIKVTGSNGNYTVAPDSTNYEMTTIGSEIGTGYNLKINGLAAGDYWLVETDAPSGYNKITTPIKVTITKTGVQSWEIKVNDSQQQDKIVPVLNNAGTILPGTGGMGTVIFTVVAVVLIAGVAVSFIISRRKEA